MSKDRKSNKEAKKPSVLTLKEKRAAKKNKDGQPDLLGNVLAPRKPAPVTGVKRT